MVVVKVEIWPYGDEKQARQVAEARIWNVQDFEGGVAEYDAAVCEEGQEPAPVEGVRHVRARGVWTLVRRVLEKVALKRKNAL